MRTKTTFTAIALAGALILGSCGGSTATDSKLELTSVSDVTEIVSAPPADLVILDIRTPEEFGTGHIDGAINIDYYAADFEAQLSGLDLTVPYVMYCNSGNRSSNALPLMDSIGFEEVYELDGGIQAWYLAGNQIDQ
ncbi:MAG: rhodanese-like domain-containing protein [bacterium]|nr:rhodanese-like domain-containing protein [bacterium]